ncbi:hypothetical protein CDD83_4722 [Cordyceps sp. RAO-2017]|nr:hypothetical protein CDD83_4722 [Cordyceps sp. RAO-2017]
MPIQPPAPQAVTVPSRLQRLTADALWLEKSCAGQKLLDSVVVDSVIIRICSIRLITQPSSFVLEPNRTGASSSAAGSTQVVKCIWMPRREEFHILGQKYTADLSYLHHVIHSPSLPNMIDTFYDGLDQGTGVDFGMLLLLLAICGSTTYSWTPLDSTRCLYASIAEAGSQTTAWLKAALDMVDQVHRMAHASLEGIQGMIILFFVVCNLEGISFRARSLLAQSIAMGRELCLHLIDHSGNSVAKESASMDSVRAEMGRRVWWYLAASDWMLAQFSVPQEGTFMVHPQQMAVRKPRNANDEDLVDGREIIDRPPDEPTSVSYLLQRIRLAEVCHGLLDLCPSILMNPESMDYGHVLEVDRRLRKYITEMPGFFSLDNNRWNGPQPSDPRRYPSIAVQRYMLNVLLHRQLCKLHLPYLVRGAVEPTFAYSHDECIKSARLIIEIEHQLRKENFPSVSFRQQTNVVLRSVFVACIALILDSCLGANSRNSLASGEEIVDAWSILQQARAYSPVASELLELSIQVLSNHTVTHPALEALGSQPKGKFHSQRGRTPPMTPDYGCGENSKNGTDTLPPALETETGNLEQQFEAFQGATDLDSIDWDRLFWGLDAPFI